MKQIKKNIWDEYSKIYELTLIGSGFDSNEDTNVANDSENKKSKKRLGKKTRWIITKYARQSRLIVEIKYWCKKLCRKNQFVRLPCDFRSIKLCTFYILYSADEGHDENEDPNGTFDIAKNTTEKGDSISKSFVKEKSFSSVQSNASQDAYIRGKSKFY